jgi:signal transduction histidine kinase
MGRVITNLVSNAVKYSPQGGLIEVEVGADPTHAFVRVRDHGVGMAPEELEDIFGRFTQVDMSSTRQFGGMGLGLFIVGEIVRAHRGTVDVESEPGSGSAFTVRIPLEHL